MKVLSLFLSPDIDVTQITCYRANNLTIKACPMKNPIPHDEKELKMTALYVAMAVRNALEDFHCKHLSDEQMKELNPLIRNAIYSALYAHTHFEDSPAARRFVQYHLDSIPPYWEMPHLNKSLAGRVSEDVIVKM